jgi:hypothetical protein
MIRSFRQAGLENFFYSGSKAGIQPAQAARLFGVTQPRISNLMHGKIEAFGLDLLVKMAAAAGLRVTMRVKRPPNLTQRQILGT